MNCMSASVSQSNGSGSPTHIGHLEDLLLPLGTAELLRIGVGYVHSGIVLHINEGSHNWEYMWHSVSTKMSHTPSLLYPEARTQRATMKILPSQDINTGERKIEFYFSFMQYCLSYK
jgi:hypothetical protein